VEPSPQITFPRNIIETGKISNAIVALRYGISTFFISIKTVRTKDVDKNCTAARKSKKGKLY